MRMVDDNFQDVLVIDADVEDNLESDVSRTRLSLASDTPLRTALTTAPALVGGDEYHAGKRSSSELSVECIPPPHPDLSSGSTTPKASTSDIQSISSGLSTLTLENSASGDRMSSPAFIDEDPDVSQTDCRYDADISTMDCSTPRRENADSAEDTAAAKPPRLSRTETQLHALCSLAPRYQSTSHECSLMSCLNQFTAAELLTGNNKFGCRRCTRRKYGSQSTSGKMSIYNITILESCCRPQSQAST